MPSPPCPALPPALPAPPRSPTPPNSPPSSPPYFLTDADLADASPGQLSLMQQMPHLLTASDLTRARRAAYSSLSCEIGQGEACNSTVAELQAAMLRAALTLRLLSMESLSQLLPAEAWGVTLESNCADGVRLVLPEPVFRLDGTAPTAALFRPTLDGDAMVLNATTLVGPRQVGGSTLYVLVLGMDPPPSGGKSLSLSVKEATLVAPLRGLMPRMTLSTRLKDCSAPWILSLAALPVNASGAGLEQEGWGAAVQAAVGLRIVFSKGVASRAEDGTLSPLNIASFRIETPNGTEALEVRMSTSTGVRRMRRGLLDAEAYVSEAVILLGLSAAPGDGELVGLSVLEGRVVDQQGKVMVGGRIVWADLQPGLPTDLGCPWLGGLLASALMAALCLLDLSWPMLPKERLICGGWRSGTSPGSKYLDLAPAAELVASPPPETMQCSSSPPESKPRKAKAKLDVSKVREKEARRMPIGEAKRAVQDAAASRTPKDGTLKHGRLVWFASLAGCTFLLAWASARQVPFAQTVVPLLPVWFAQGVVLSSQCSKRQSGLGLLPALRTLGVCAMSIAVAIVTAIPSATGLSPLRRLMVVGPAALVAALFIAVDAVFSRQPFCCAFKKKSAAVTCVMTESPSGQATTPLGQGTSRRRSERLHSATRLVWMVAAKEARVHDLKEDRVGSNGIPGYNTRISTPRTAFAQVGSSSPAPPSSSPPSSIPPSLPPASLPPASLPPSSPRLSSFRVFRVPPLSSSPPSPSLPPPSLPPSYPPRWTPFMRMFGGSSAPPIPMPSRRVSSEARRSSRRSSIYISSAERLVLGELAEVGVSPPPSPPGAVHNVANKVIADRRPSEPSRLCPCLRWPLSCCCYILPYSRPTCRGMLRALGPEAWGSLALLIVVLAIVVGVPPFTVDDGATFSCHSIPVTVISTLTALLAPLSLGLLRRVRRTRVGLGAGQGSGLNVCLAARNDETTAVRSLRPCGMASALKLTTPVAWTEPVVAMLDPEGVKVAHGAHGEGVKVAEGAKARRRALQSSPQWRRSTALPPLGDFLQDRMSVVQASSAEGAQVPLPDRSSVVRDRPSQPNGLLGRLFWQSSSRLSDSSSVSDSFSHATLAKDAARSSDDVRPT